MTDQAISPLRRRMIEDMTIRKLGVKTQSGYIRAVKNFADFLRHSSARLNGERMDALAAAESAMDAAVTELAKVRHLSQQMILVAREAGAPGPASLTWQELAK